MDLDEKQIARYTHHIILKDVGGEGQRRLLSSKVLIVGVGGLGSPAAYYLAAAGVGTIGLCDNDHVELSNLQRQIIHHTGDIGKHKVVSASEKIVLLNPDVKVVPITERFDQSNAHDLVGAYDFIIDASDNFPTKYLINDICVETGKSYSNGGIVGFKGQTFTHIPGSLCLRCIFPDPPDEGVILHCRGAGILGAVAGIIGSIQATEAIKWILKRGDMLSDRMFIFDALQTQMRVAALRRRESCVICGAVDHPNTRPRENVLQSFKADDCNGTRDV